MNSNQKGSSGGSSKQQSPAGGKQSGSQGSGSGSQGGGQGGTHEQHVEAGRQSHKNDANKSSGGSGKKDR